MWQLKGEEKSNKILKIKVLLSRENQLVKDSSGSINVQRSWLNITEFKPVGDEEEKKSLKCANKNYWIFHDHVKASAFVISKILFKINQKNKKSKAYFTQ